MKAKKLLLLFCSLLSLLAYSQSQSERTFGWISNADFKYNSSRMIVYFDINDWSIRNMNTTFTISLIDSLKKVIKTSDFADIQQYREEKSKKGHRVQHCKIKIDLSEADIDKIYGSVFVEIGMKNPNGKDNPSNPTSIYSELKPIPNAIKKHLERIPSALSTRLADDKESSNSANPHNSIDSVKPANQPVVPTKKQDAVTGCVSGDCQNGIGTFIYENGSKYEGEFKDSKANGQGTNYWSNGNKYVGEWANDFENGQGILYYTNGEKKEGLWVNGEFIGGCISGNCVTGNGVFSCSDGNRYEGGFLNGLANGLGTYFYSNGDKIVGNWKDGNTTGNVTYIFSSNGQVKVGEFKVGYLIGNKTLLHSSENPNSDSARGNKENIANTSSSNNTPANTEQKNNISISDFIGYIFLGIIVLFSIIKLATGKITISPSSSNSRNSPNFSTGRTEKREQTRNNPTFVQQSIRSSKPLHNWLCQNCSYMPVKNVNRPTSAGCNGDKYGVHRWYDLGEIGNDTYHCSNCGVQVESKNRPISAGCRSNKMNNVHKWMKL